MIGSMRRPTDTPSIWARPRQIGFVLGVAYGLVTFLLGLAAGDAARDPQHFADLVVGSVWNGILGFIVGFLLTVILLTYARVMRD
jgi:hypothetical protein